MQKMQVAARMRSHGCASEAQKKRGPSPRTRNKNRTQNGSDPATACRSGKHVRTISSFYANFADAIAAQMNFIRLRMACSVKRLANKFVLVSPFKDAWKCE
jgi:hypothetical protein